MYRRIKNIVLFVLMIPTVSLTMHNLIPHHHHSGCPDNKATEVEDHCGVHACCEHQKQAENVPEQKESCIITSLPPVYYSFSPYFTFSSPVIINPVQKFNTDFFNSEYSTQIFTVCLKIPLLRAPPYLLV